MSNRVAEDGRKKSRRKQGRSQTPQHQVDAGKVMEDGLKAVSPNQRVRMSECVYQTRGQESNISRGCSTRSNWPIIFVCYWQGRRKNDPFGQPASGATCHIHANTCAAGTSVAGIYYCATFIMESSLVQCKWVTTPGTYAPP